jgi:exoribonuclease-2
MNVFFEESGDFKVGTVLSQAGEAYQVEMPSGKRTKVKAKDVLLQFEKPAPATLLEQAKGIAAEVDLEFLWEVAGEEEFGFAELGAEYFGHAPLPPRPPAWCWPAQCADLFLQKRPRPLQGGAGTVAARGAGRHREEEAAGAGPGPTSRN